MKAIICTCIKDENNYLSEWIEWHLGLGFEHIYLFEDYGSRSHRDITDRYNNVTLLSIDVAKDEINTVEKRQRKVYSYSLKAYKDQYDWIAFIDADEFVEFEEGYNLEKLLSEHSEYPGIILSWRLYGANGRVSKPTGGLVESHPEPDDSIDYGKLWYGAEWSVKSFANLRKSPVVKHIHLIEGAVNMNGGNTPEYKIFHKAWIRHYYTKSWEEWCDRIFQRGDLCNGNRLLAQFFDVNPGMEHLREELIASVADRIPNGTYWLDRKRGLIAGGNVKKIMALNYEKN